MNRFLRASSLVVTDRRWAATLSAAALGFGLFIGVAIGPGAAGSLATGAQQVIEIPGIAANAGESGGGGGGGATAALGGEPAALPAEAEEAPIAEAFPSSIPLASEASEPPPAAEETGPPPAEPAAEEAEGEAEALEGTVVQVNPAAGSYAFAISGGELVAVHAPKPPPAGAKLSVPLGQLANGTFAEEDDREQQGKAVKATFKGVVTFADPDPAQPAYTVSGRGASLLVHAPVDPTGAAPSLPPLGSFATVTASIEKGTLAQRQIEVEPGEPSTYLEVAGTVTTVLPETAQLLLSADGSRESGKDLTLTVPPAIDTTQLKIGDSYLATATIEPDGTLTLAGIASDEHMKGAENASSAQGDLKRKAASRGR